MQIICLSLLGFQLSCPMTTILLFFLHLLTPTHPPPHPAMASLFHPFLQLLCPCLVCSPILYPVSLSLQPRPILPGDLVHTGLAISLQFSTPRHPPRPNSAIITSSPAVEGCSPTPGGVRLAPQTGGKIRHGTVGLSRQPANTDGVGTEQLQDGS